MGMNLFYFSVDDGRLLVSKGSAHASLALDDDAGLAAFLSEHAEGADDLEYALFSSSTDFPEEYGAPESYDARKHYDNALSLMAEGGA